MLYTIGYSAFFQIEDFLACLRARGIGAVVDVRAFPNISSFDQYKGDNLKAILKENAIHYLSFAAEFGARPADDSLYTDNAADFTKISQSPQFQKGCERIRKGLENFNICLMCAEKDPAVCHRSILITHALEKIYPDMAIRHLLPGKILSQKDIDADLKKRYALFDGPGSLETCYRLHGKSIAWRKK